jgi:hypothetical protein
MIERTTRRGAVALALVCTMFAGCESSDSPTAAPAARPSFDGGMGYGSGNRAQEGDATTTTTSGTAADSTGRSGMGYGSGN